MLERVFKKLDLLIVKAFIGPFIVTFFITLFVLVLQFFWLYIDDVVGKGIDPLTVGQLVFYLSATLVPLALPLAVLLSSIMTLGNLGETFELIAIKAAGISLLRFMRPLLLVSIVLTIIAFFFNNNLLPIANLKMNTIKSDIIYTKPAFDIKEGVFYDRIEGFVIKIGKKEKDGSTIRNVVIYEQNGGAQDNMIIADSGRMIVTPDKQSLEFILKDGWRYQDKPNTASPGSQLMRMGFKQYKKVLDISSFKMNKTNDSLYRNNYQMLTLRQLTHNIDSINNTTAIYIKRSAASVNQNLKFSAFLDTTGWDKIEKDTNASKYLMPLAWARDSIDKTWKAARHSRDSLDKAQDAQEKARADAAKAASKAVAKTSPGHPTGGAATSPGKQGPPSAGGSPGATTDSGKQVPHGDAPPPGHPVNGSTPTPGHPVNGSTPTPATPAAKTTPQNAPPSNTQPPGRIMSIPGGVAVNRLSNMKTPPAPTLLDLLPDTARNAVLDRAISVLNGAKANIDQPVALYNSEIENLRQHEIAWHEKITLAVAVLVMFLIGAPLGSIIRKGGIGLPLVFAVVFFVVFFLLNNFGKKFTKEGVLSPIEGMWMATYVLTPIGLFLTYKALNDSQLLNKEFYFRVSRKIRLFIRRLREGRSNPVNPV